MSAERELVNVVKESMKEQCDEKWLTVGKRMSTLSTFLQHANTEGKKERNTLHNTNPGGVRV